MSNKRLQKLISEAGICSRRKAEILINQGKVSINGSIAKIGDKADISIDKITVNGFHLPKKKADNVILLNKPSGVISSCYDNYGRKTVLSFLPKQYRIGMYPIGRLDFESRGAIILTNNGELTLQLTHPKYNHIKTYSVWVDGILSKSDILKWEEGIEIDGKKTMPAILILKKSFNNKTLLEINLKEGRNRQIRKTALKLGHKVLDLKRVSIATITLNDLKEGCWRKLEEKEWKPLLKHNSFFD